MNDRINVTVFMIFQILLHVISVTPKFKYIANMHGNEVVGRELLLQLMVDMCEKYLNNDERTKWLVDNTYILLMPSMNPDGWELACQEVCFNCFILMFHHAFING